MSSKKKILIVDDSEMNRSLLTDMLSDQFDIIEAENGQEAAVVLHNQEHEIALMLLDIVMPVMDGFALLALMNKNGWIKSIPVIMISAETVPIYVDRAYDLGAMEYITRPFDERTVQHRVMSSIMLTAKHKELTRMVTEQMYEKEKDNRLMIEILSNLVEFRNGESGLHVLHIQAITGLLLDALAQRTDQYPISERDKNLICTASALHDIGKIAVPTEILNKPGRLTQEEYEIMKTHSEEGGKILLNIPGRQTEPLIQYGYQICRWHHERYDGKGYPDGLKGDEIPIAAQIVALADVYDALTSKRCYKTAYAHETAVAMIMGGECGSFNPELLGCLQMVSEQLSQLAGAVEKDYNSEQEILRTVDQMLRSNELSASDRTLRLLERERMKYQTVTDLSQEILFEYATEPEMITLYARSADMLGLPETILNPRGSAFGTQVFSPKDFRHLLDRIHSTDPEHTDVEERYLLTIRGQKKWCKVVVRTIWMSGETFTCEGAIGKIVDIHEETERMRQLEEMVNLDPLTGLLNHNAASRRISTLLEAGDKHYALVLLDLDNFKAANDWHGHLFGDQVLKHVASGIQRCTLKGEIASRLGDEFMVFMEYQHKDLVGPRVEKLFRQLGDRYKGFEVQVSMGVAFSDACHGEFETLFHMADTAMYSVKNGGKNGYAFYDPALDGALSATE